MHCRHGEEADQGRIRRRPGSEADASAKAGAPYVVLARKYRPATFDDLIGQDAMVTTLQERVRHRPHRSRLHADRRARGRQDHHGAHPLPRAQLRARGRRQADLRHARVRPPLRRDHGRPPSRRAGDGRRLQHRRRQHPRDHRERALQAADGPLQGVPDRRGAHALQGRLQRAAEDAGRAARAREVHLRHHRGAQGAGDGAVALPALRPAARRRAGAGRALPQDRRQGGRRGRGRRRWR